MGFLSGFFGGRKRRERRAAASARVRAVLEESGPDAAWAEVVQALIADPDDDALLHLAAHVLRSSGERATAELFDRAADAPHDPQRHFELGSSLLSEEQPEIAAALLERALAFVPFDAVVRSELALAHARSGRPEKVLEALALHPCLADDPGALFEFGWAAMLTGDLDSAEGALQELQNGRGGARALRKKLELALRRARVRPARRPPDARDYYFVEHAAILVDAGGPLGGRYVDKRVDEAWVRRCVSDIGWILETLLPRPRHILALDDAHRPFAEALARACGGDVAPFSASSALRGVLPLLAGASIEELPDHSILEQDGLWLCALGVDWSRSLSRAPAIVGAFASRASIDADAFAIDPDGPRPDPSPELREFVTGRRDLLPPRGARVRAAYVPDAPLPRE